MQATVPVACFPWHSLSVYLAGNSVRLGTLTARSLLWKRANV